jgi:hypothetical protein
MGGLINPSSKPKTASTPVAATAATQAATAAATAAAAATAEEETRKRRVEAAAKQRSGRAGTIVTSARGLLVPTDWTPQRKSLLGE